MSLYHECRPTKLSEVIGQDKAVSILQKMLKDKLPNTILLSGATGVGKTSVARILAHEVGCHNFNLREINCGHVRGIDSVREMDELVTGSKPMIGDSRVMVHILDEIVQLSKTTQQAMLKTLEDAKPWAYFFLCTTDTAGLLPTFLGRCVHVTLQLLDSSAVTVIVKNAARTKQRTLSSRIVQEIVKIARGNARKAINLVEAALTADTETEQLEAVDAAVDVQTERVEFLAKELLQNRPEWSRIAKCIQEIKLEEIEGVRQQTLAYVCAVLLNNARNGERCCHIIKTFSQNWLGINSKAGLTAACWEICNG